ncbi:hypothetical protein DC094_20695 [Pelagibaculum spongiae]|uniref:Uncharacterized protein n=1 Tax=Pelagibaculum spongiae TaxID=2080658 RepID=A0A2V1GP53_9GAMM|nr:hypothetical protein DC094_20695 [Pelagibaculum spongiae]
MHVFRFFVTALLLNNYAIILIISAFRLDRSYHAQAAHFFFTARADTTGFDFLWCFFGDDVEK